MANRKTEKAGPYTLHNKVKIIRGGAAYYNSIDEIAAAATYSLHFQTYIFDEDETGHRVADALMGAARRGVLVYLLLDAYASQRLSSGFIATIKEAGIHFRYFEPFFKSRNYYFGRRLHHKVLVADGSVCLVGGLNVSNRYNDMPGAPAWLDWALQVNGDVAAELDKVCVRMWNRGLFTSKCLATQNPETEHNGHCLVRIRRNDWVYNRTEITKSYYEIFAKAAEDVIIMTSYFWPARRLLKSMEVAARRGVRISVVLTGNADVPLAKYAERYLYNRLFRNKITIYEYTGNVLHGKLAIRDNEWITVGSYNLNNISAFASVELNLDVDDNNVATTLRKLVTKIIEQDCRLITRDDFTASGNIVKRFFYFLSYTSIQALFFLFTFYFSQRKRRN